MKVAYIHIPHHEGESFQVEDLYFDRGQRTLTAIVRSTTPPHSAINTSTFPLCTSLNFLIYDPSDVAQHYNLYDPADFAQQSHRQVVFNENELNEARAQFSNPKRYECLLRDGKRPYQAADGICIRYQYLKSLFGCDKRVCVSDMMHDHAKKNRRNLQGISIGIREEATFSPAIGHTL